MKYAFIVNPASGQGKHDNDLIPEIEELIAGNPNRDIKVYYTRGEKDATVLADLIPSKALTPYNIIDIISSVADDNAVVVTDVGQHQMWTAQRYPFKKPRTFLSSGGLGTMGFGMGAAIGANIATNEKTVLVTGDGSFGMNLNELATAVSFNIPMVIVIMNNGVLGMV